MNDSFVFELKLPHVEVDDNGVWGPQMERLCESLRRRYPNSNEPAIIGVRRSIERQRILFQEDPKSWISSLGFSDQNQQNIDTVKSYGVLDDESLAEIMISLHKKWGFFME